VLRRTADINNINHVGVAVRDLAATAIRYETMGFALTPYSPHSAAWKPGDPVQPLGSGNRCVMFENTYLEIRRTGVQGALHRACGAYRRRQHAGDLCKFHPGGYGGQAQADRCGWHRAGVDVQLVFDAVAGTNVSKWVNLSGTINREDFH
jgi:hypothetical protein